MNIAFFLLPKSEVITTTLQATLRQTLERMEYHRYTAVPILSDDGHYVGPLRKGIYCGFSKIQRISASRMLTVMCLQRFLYVSKINPFIFMQTWWI